MQFSFLFIWHQTHLSDKRKSLFSVSNADGVRCITHSFLWKAWRGCDVTAVWCEKCKNQNGEINEIFFSASYTYFCAVVMLLCYQSVLLAKPQKNIVHSLVWEMKSYSTVPPKRTTLFQSAGSAASATPIATRWYTASVCILHWQTFALEWVVLTSSVTFGVAPSKDAVFAGRNTQNGTGEWVVQ